MNLSTKIAFTAIACFTICFASGCVGPMACGPGGCGGPASGPLALNSCGGCSDCQGCGELYVDPWINHPADCHDPCDQCGNHNGQSCGKCRSVFDGLASLWGYRCDTGCDDCGDSSCDGGCGPAPSCGALGGLACGCEGSCDGGCEASCGMEATCGFEVGSNSACGDCASCTGGGDGIHYVSSEPIYSEPIADSMISQPYQPHRAKKIFRPKSNVAGGGSSLR
jgi:hypothetical protein